MHSPGLKNRGSCKRMSLWIAILILALAVRSYGQSQPPGQSKDDPVSLTLDQAVEFALSHYPAVKAVLAQAAASRSGVDLAGTAYLPRTDLVWQANRATRNNVFGLFFPQPIPLPISGPVLGTNNGTNVWGTATGFLFNWEPFDLGLRKAQVGTARAQEAQAKPPSKSLARMWLSPLPMAFSRYSHRSRLFGWPRRAWTVHACWPTQSTCS